MKRLMIDMDNCVTNAYFMEHINKFLGTNYKLDDQTDFYLQNLTGDRINEFWKYMSNNNFYGDCPLIEGCYEALEILNKKYELYIVTAYLYDSEPDISGDNLKNKYDYLKKRLPFISPKQYIFISDKTLIHFDVGVDDKMNNLLNCDKKYLMNAWHNKNISNNKLSEEGIVRVSTWKEILELLDY